MKTVTLNRRLENYFTWPFATFTGGFVRSINCLNRNKVNFAVLPLQRESSSSPGPSLEGRASWFFGKTFHEFYAGGNDAMD